ncbi:MAG: O-antigen ligase family protein [Cyanobacteriota bacterium]
MINTNYSELDFPRESFKISPLSFPEQVIYWTIVLTPLCWLSSLQTLLYPAIVIGLLVYRFEIDKLIRNSLPACIWAWLAMAVVMLWTAMLGLGSMGAGLAKIAAALVTFSKSYFLIFAALALPFWHCIRLRVVTRAVAWMATGYLVTIAIELVMLFAGVGKEGFTSPLARLVPGDALGLRVSFADFQNFFGISLPRTALYMPDPPILGVCALLCFFICLGETDRRLRRFAVAGCLAALMISFSRSAWVCLILALLIVACFRSRWARHGSLWVAALTSFLCALLGLTLNELINKPMEIFTKARAASSSDREYVVQKTLEAWQQYPWFGWGVIRGSVRWYKYDISLGSFSTYASVLYLHGLVGFIVFVTALGLTLWSFWKQAIRDNPLCKRAFASLVALCVLCQATPLSWMTVYFWFYFVWLGAILFELQQQEPTISSWEHLSGQTG